MATDPLVVGLIMARGGGSTLYRKNAFRLHGKPVLAWAIDILRRAGFIDTVFVWTEDAELADIAREAGAVALPRPRDMVHYFGGSWTFGEWCRTQDGQMEEHLGRRYDYVVPLNCNCICLRPESLRAMYDLLRESRGHVFRVQAVSRVAGGLCLENPANGRLFPIWNDTDRAPDANPPLFRMVGAAVVDHTVRNTGDSRTRYHEVSPREGFDFQHADDIPFALHSLSDRVREEGAS